MKRQPFRTRLLPISSACAAFAAGLLLAGCGDDAAKPATTAATSSTPLAADDALPPRDALPDCSRVEATLGGVLSGWKLVDESGPWENPGQSGYGVDCIWWSPHLQSANDLDKLQGASLMVRINVTPQMQSEADVRAIGWVIDDPAVNALGGYLTVVGGQLAFDAPLGPVPPEVVVGKVSVSVTRSGVMLVNSTDEGSAFTHRDAVDAAVAVHRLIRK
mgnify:CR=1 FL=1